MVHTCKICNKDFSSLSSYERHIKNKNTCDPIKRREQHLGKVTCHKCKKILSSTTRLKSHLEICIHNQSQQEIYKQMIDELTKQNQILVEKMDKQNEMLNKKIDKLANKESNTININTINQQNIFNIVPFGEEKFDYITDKDYNQIFKKGHQSIQTLIPMIYCNDKKPENMNVYINNFNDDNIRVFDGKNWIFEKKDYVLSNMYNSKRDHLEYKFEDLYDNLTENAKYFFEKFRKYDDDEESINSIKYDIKNILYTNRKNVIKNPKKVKNTNTNDIDYIPDTSMFF